jgi:hypothetical protein
MWYFCRPAAKYTIAGEIRVSSNPQNKKLETNERLNQKMTGKRKQEREKE